MNDMFDLIIFDMDGTLYDISDVVKEGFYLGVNFLVETKGYVIDDAIKLLNNNDIYPYVVEKAKSTTQLFASLGYDISEWNDYRSIRFPYQEIKKENSVSNKLLLEFRKHAKIVLLTNNTQKNVDNVLKHIGIKQETFNRIYLNNKKQKDLNKKLLMQDIINDYNVDARRVLSIGDRLDVDALPMLELGGKAIIIKNPKSLEKVINDFPNFKNNKQYKFM